MLLRLPLLIVALILPVQAVAATLTVGPSDCSAAAVNSAISAAGDGDTVQLTCTGSVTWTAQVTIPGTKGITVNGGGTNTPKSSPNFPLTIVSLQSEAISIVAAPNKPLSRITGFKFQNPGATAGDSGFLNVSGCGTGKTGLGSFRIDNNYFDTISGRTIVGILSSCDTAAPAGPAPRGLYGLFDNNTMHDAYRADDMNTGPYGVQVWNHWHGPDFCWGKDGWTDPFKFGDENFVFIEDNVYENVTATPNRYMRHYISAELGGRFVVRYNTFTVNVASPDGSETDLIEAHGLCLCESNGCSGRGGEVYRNTFSGSRTGRHIMPRGGTWLIYDNLFDDLGSRASSIYLMEYRAGDSSMFGQCSPTCPCVSSWVSMVSDASRYPLPQQISGTYIWNNLYHGVNQAPAVDGRGIQSQYIQADRDYFVSAGKPAALSWYLPFPYPHPLRNVGASSNPPSPPQTLRVQ